MLAQFADRSRVRAAALVAAGLLFPPLIFLAGASCAMTVLRRSVWDGLAVGAMGYAVVAVAGMLAGVPTGAEVLAVILLVAALSADVLRRHGLAIALLTGMGGAIVVTWAANAALGDSAAYWKQWFVAVVEQIRATGGEVPQGDMELLMAAPIWPQMTAVAVTMVLLVGWLGLFLGRAWQASLVNPGGWGREFRELRYGRSASIVSMVVFTASVLPDMQPINDAAVVLLYAWVVQGFAYVHWLAARAGNRGALVLAVYVAFFITLLGSSPLAILLPLGAVAGELIDARRRIERRWPRKHAARPEQGSEQRPGETPDEQSKRRPDEQSDESDGDGRP